MFQEANDERYQSHSVNTSKLLLDQKNDTHPEGEIPESSSSAVMPSSIVGTGQVETYNDDDLWSETLMETSSQVENNNSSTDFSLPPIDTFFNNQRPGSSIPTCMQDGTSSLLPDQTPKLQSQTNNKNFSKSNNDFVSAGGYLKKSMKKGSSQFKSTGNSRNSPAISPTSATSTQGVPFLNPRKTSLSIMAPRRVSSPRRQLGKVHHHHHHHYHHRTPSSSSLSPSPPAPTEQIESESLISNPTKFKRQMSASEQAEKITDALKTLQKEQHQYQQQHSKNNSKNGTERLPTETSGQEPFPLISKKVSSPKLTSATEETSFPFPETDAKEKLQSKEDFVKERPSSGIPESRPSLTLWKYLLLELGVHNSQVSTEEKTEQLGNFVRLPFYLERVIVFGSLACLDSFLYIFTILPLRFCYAVSCIFFKLLGLRKNTRIPVARRADAIKGMIFIFVLYSLSQLDTSMIYHNIRGQSAVKLYVMFNVLEIADKLCSALGQDILDCLFSGNTLGVSRIFPLSTSIRPIVFTALATVYIYIHSLVILYQIISLNVAVNSYSNALLTLLLSNQFSEIKSTVFKKFERENLFQLTCADVSERFQLTVMMCVIGLRNIVEVSSSGLVPRSWSGWNRWLGALLGPMIVVVGSEICVDWLKHAYIAKFNNIRPRVYRKFLDVLVFDYCDNAFSDQIMTKRIGIPILPLASVFLRMLLQSYSILVEHQREPTTTTIGKSSGLSGSPTSILSTCITTSLKSKPAEDAIKETTKILGSSSGPMGTALSRILDNSTGYPNFETISQSIKYFLNKFHVTLPQVFHNNKFSLQSFSSCIYSQSKTTVSSFIPNSADSFYSFISLLLIVLISFILLFAIKLTLGLFLLQYTSKRRVKIMNKAKASQQQQPQPQPQPAHNNSNAAPFHLPTSNLTSAFQQVQSQHNPSHPPPVVLPPINTSSPNSVATSVGSHTVPVTPVSRGRSSSQQRHGSRHQTLSQTGNASKSLLNLLAAGSNDGSKTASRGRSLSNNAMGGYESDESDHVPGPIKGQGVVEVNELVRERMYDVDETVPPSKPRKTYIKDFKDLCKIQRFKMTAKQIW